MTLGGEVQDTEAGVAQSDPTRTGHSHSGVVRTAMGKTFHHPAYSSLQVLSLLSPVRHPTDSTHCELVRRYGEGPL